MRAEQIEKAEHASVVGKPDAKGFFREKRQWRPFAIGASLPFFHDGLNVKDAPVARREAVSSLTFKPL